MLRIALCDNEIMFRVLMEREMATYLKKCGVIPAFRGYDTSVWETEERKTFLEQDIYLISAGAEESEGFRLAGKLRMYRPDARIILLATAEHCVWAGYRLGALFCLNRNKLSEKEYLKKCLDAICARMVNITTVRFPFLGGEKVFRQERLVYVESRLHKLFFYIYENGLQEYSLYGKLEEAERIFPKPCFARVHQSFLVNFRHVREISSKQLILFDDTYIAISRARKKLVQEQYKEYLKTADEIMLKM